MPWNTHPFNGPLSRTTRVSRYQKGKTNLDFTEARDSEWHWHQLGHMQVCISLQTDNHASTPPLMFFYRPDALPAAQPTASKHWRHTRCHENEIKNPEIRMKFQKKYLCFWRYWIFLNTVQDMSKDVSVPKKQQDPSRCSDRTVTCDTQKDTWQQLIPHHHCIVKIIAIQQKV